VADWTMSFTWGLVIGTASPIPYFYSIFFITVLVHRTTRDFERCVPYRALTNDSLILRA
jgi:delta24(24(1))-sterol reductase